VEIGRKYVEHEKYWICWKNVAPLYIWVIVR
jgi:hypothetical protein